MSRYEVTLYFDGDGLEDNDDWVPGETVETMLPLLVRYALTARELYPEDTFVRRVGADVPVDKPSSRDPDTRGDR